MYLILGGPMDSLSMILLTIPVVYPVTLALDFGLSHEEFSIWFGILTLIVVEVGLISPPVGMNLFVINSMSKGTSMGQTFRGRDAVPDLGPRAHRDPCGVPVDLAVPRAMALLTMQAGATHAFLNQTHNSRAMRATEVLIFVPRKGADSQQN